MKKKIFVGKAPEPEVDEPPRGGLRFITKTREPELEEPRRGGIRFVAKAREPEIEEPRRGGIRFFSRSKPGAALAGTTPSAKASKPSSRRPQTPAQRYSSDDSGGNPAKIAITVAALLVVIVLVAIICAAGRPRALPPVPAPRIATQSEPSGPPERMWMKEYMQEHGPSEELKARKARMGQFMYTGSATGGQQN